jgi:mono/diheme cytochrome c family protein
MQPTSSRHQHRRALAALLLLVAIGCEPPGKPNPANRRKLPDQITDFHELYAANCAGCHGADGELGPAPPLNDPLFIAIIPDADLEAIIRDGRDGTPMPPFAKTNGGPLTDEQVKIIAAGIKSNWKPDEPPSPEPPPYALTQTAAASTSGNRERGAAIFARACAACHGEQGHGVEMEGRIVSAINAPAFLALISDQALRRIIITGRHDLGMPNFAQQDGRPKDFQPLTSAEIDDLVALLADWRATGGSIAKTPTQ